MKKIALIFLLSIYVCGFSYAQELSKQIIGSWKLINAKYTDAKGNDLKTLASQDKIDIKEIKEMISILKSYKEQMVVTLQKDGIAITASGTGKWELSANKLTITTEHKKGKISEHEQSIIRIVNKNLEMGTPQENDKILFLVFKKLKKMVL